MPKLQHAQLARANIALCPGDYDRIRILSRHAGAGSQVGQRRANNERNHADDAHDHEYKLGVLPQIVHVPTGHITLPSEGSDDPLTTRGASVYPLPCAYSRSAAQPPSPREIV